MKKITYTLFFLIAITVINSCSDSNYNDINNSKIIQLEKKKMILKKFKELGLDTSRVIFSDTIKSNNAIKVESINDLENVLDFEIYLNKNNSIFDNDDINTKKSSTSGEKKTNKTTFSHGWGSDIYDGSNYDGEMTHFQIEVPFPRSAQIIKRDMRLFISFDYDRAELQNTKGWQGVSGVSSFLIGSTFGYSYNHVDFSLDGANVGGVRLTINGILNRNIFIEGIGTIYSSHVRTLGHFHPRRNNTYEGHFFIASV